MTQRWHIPSPGPIGVFPVQSADGKRIRVRRRVGGTSGAHVLVDDTGTEWIAINNSGTVARLADVEGWHRAGETLAEAASRYPDGAA